MITHEELRRRLEYDPDTGHFTWRVSPTWGRPAGSRAGSPNLLGYICVRVQGGNYRAHRLAWFYVHGEWPEHEIDHINGVRDDNRLANLRPATAAQNQANRPSPSTNKSGYKGVSWDRKAKRWRAQIYVKGRKKHLGHFVDIEEAADVYAKAAVEIYGEYTNRAQAESFAVRNLHKDGGGAHG